MFDFAVEQPKFVQLLIGVIAFVVFVGLLLGLVTLSERGRRGNALLFALGVVAGVAALLVVGLLVLPKFTRIAVAIGIFVLVLSVVVWLLTFVGSREGRGKDRLPALLFLAPCLSLLGIGLVVPAIRTTVLSFKDPSGARWVGFDNYTWMFADAGSRTTLRNTLIWVLVAPLLSTAIGLVYAVLIDKAKFEKGAKSLIFMPMAISFVGAGIIWKFVYADRPKGQEQIGLLNQFVAWFGGDPKQWLVENPPINTLLLIVVMVWIQAGFAMVVLSAAIKAIPGEIVEAARVDGVNAWQMFWRVTLPSVRSALTVVLVTISIATLKIFDIVRTMTNGNFDTSVIANEMYNNAFRYGQPGRGSAFAVFLFVLVIPIVIYQVRALRQQRAIH